MCRNDERLSRFFFPSKNLLRSLTLIIYALKSLMYARWAMRRSHMRSSGVLAFSFLCFASLVSAAWPCDPSSYLLFLPPGTRRPYAGHVPPSPSEERSPGQAAGATGRRGCGRVLGRARLRE